LTGYFILSLQPLGQKDFDPLLSEPREVFIVDGLVVLGQRVEPGFLLGSEVEQTLAHRLFNVISGLLQDDGDLFLARNLPPADISNLKTSERLVGDLHLSQVDVVLRHRLVLVPAFLVPPLLLPVLLRKLAFVDVAQNPLQSFDELLALIVNMFLFKDLPKPVFQEGQLIFREVTLLHPGNVRDPREWLLAIEGAAGQ